MLTLSSSKFRETDVGSAVLEEKISTKAHVFSTNNTAVTDNPTQPAPTPDAPDDLQVCTCCTANFRVVKLCGYLIAKFTLFYT